MPSLAGSPNSWARSPYTRPYEPTGPTSGPIGTTRWSRATLYADPAIAPVVVQAIGAGMPIYGNKAELEARYNTEESSTLEKV